MSAVNDMGILITGFVGPIPCGCQTISKIQIGAGVGGFGVEVVGTYVFAGYFGVYCIQRVNWWGVCG